MYRVCWMRSLHGSPQLHAECCLKRGWPERQLRQQRDGSARTSSFSHRATGRRCWIGIFRDRCRRGKANLAVHIDMFELVLQSNLALRTFCEKCVKTFLHL